MLDSGDWTGRVVVLMVVNDCADGCLLIDEIFLVEITAVTLAFVIFMTVDRVAYGVVLLRAVREVTVEVLPGYTVEFSTTIDIRDVIVILVTKVESASVCNLSAIYIFLFYNLQKQQHLPVVFELHLGPV